MTPVSGVGEAAGVVSWADNGGFTTAASIMATINAVIGVWERMALSSMAGDRSCRTADSKWPATKCGVIPYQTGVESPHAPGWHDRQDDQGHVLMGLLKHPAVTRDADQGQEELLAEIDQGRRARRQAEDEEETGA